MYKVDDFMGHTIYQKEKLLFKWNMYVIKTSYTPQNHPIYLVCKQKFKL